MLLFYLSLPFYQKTPIFCTEWSRTTPKYILIKCWDAKIDIFDIVEKKCNFVCFGNVSITYNINDCVPMENGRKRREIKLVTTDRRRNYLTLEPNYHTTKWFSENLLAIEMKKVTVKMKKPVYLGLSILGISKTLINEFWYDYIKPKYHYNVKICYMNTGSFIILIRTEDVYDNIADDVEKRFDT